MSIRKIFEAAGATIILLFPHLKAALSPYHMEIYHRQEPLNTVYGAQLLWILAVWLICWVVDFLLIRYDPETQNFSWLVLIGFLFYRLSIDYPTTTDTRTLTWKIASILTNSRNADLIGLGVALVLLTLWLVSKYRYQKTVRGIRITLAGIGLCMLWILPEMIHITVHKAALGQESFNHAIEPARQSAHTRRIVWVLMDELSYKLAFEAPPPGVTLTNFAAFRKQSYEFANVDPIGTRTDVIVPGLMIGKVVKQVHSDADARLWIFSDGDGWQLFNEQKAIFADAKKAGWSNGLLGYYNPYCRFMPNTVDRCNWMWEDLHLAHMSPNWSILKNSLMPLKHWGGRLRPEDFDQDQPPEHLRLVQDQIAYADKLIDDTRLKFLFLHVALPHPPGPLVKTATGTRISSYRENLQTSDRVFGEFCRRLASEPGGEDTTIMLTSDHSWRTWSWSGSLYWLPDDSALAKGNYDPRPVLLVHLPGETENHRVDAKMSEINEHELLERMLHKEDFTEADMDEFVKGYQ